MKRTLQQIVADIRRDWSNVNYAAKPYLDAMSALDSVNQMYGLDSGRSIILYFLSNATTWRGETARRCKKELNDMVK